MKYAGLLLPEMLGLCPISSCGGPSNGIWQQRLLQVCFLCAPVFYSEMVSDGGNFTSY